MEFKTTMEKMSYTLGLDVTRYLATLPVKIDFKFAAQAMLDAAENKPAISQEEYQANMQEFQKMMQHEAEEKMTAVAGENKSEGEKFLAENAKNENVKVTGSGLQYIVIAEGEGVKPAASDQVKVHYTGSLINGQVFDSSVSRGEPAVFGVTQVIPGWTEALQLMSVGAKYKLFIPAAIAYGERGAGQVIPPNATLIFEVELLDIVK